MNEAFTLVSSEGERFETDRHLLTVNCITFADILANGDANAKPECQLQESSKDVNLFLEALEGGRAAPYTYKELRTLTELGKKYQSRLLHLIVKGEVVNDLDDNLYRAYVVTAGIEDPALGRYIAKLRVAKGCTQKGNAGEWDQRYDDFRRAHLVALRNSLLDSDKYKNCFAKDGTVPPKVTSQVSTAAFKATPASSPTKLLRTFRVGLANRYAEGNLEEEVGEMVVVMERAFRAEVKGIKF